MEIINLAAELDRLKKTSLDVVSSTSMISAIEDGGTLKLDIGQYGKWPLNKIGSLQLAEKTGIPVKYYEKMLEEGMIDLTATNVNAWLSKQADKRLIRIADGKVRAILSDRYRPIDNYDLAILTMERAKANGATVQNCELTDSRMYIKLVVPHTQEEVKAGDRVICGVVVSNSEVGQGAFRVEPFVYRVICKNGLIGTQSLYKIHIGGKLEVGLVNIYRDDTLRALDSGLWKQVRDIVDSTFNPKVQQAMIEQLRGSQAIPIEKPQEAIDVTAKNLDLSDKAKLDLLRYFAKEGDTVFGLVNGITRLAQDYSDYDQRVSIERYAGEVLEKAMVVAE